MKKDHGSPGTSKSFTLIELLVVVAIIAVLIAILLPSLQQARRTAQSAVCLTHLRTMASAIVGFYAEENGGYFLGNDHGSHWIRNGFAGIDAHYGEDFGYFPKRIEPPPLNSYIGLPTAVTTETDPAVAACPSDASRGDGISDLWYYGTSYIYNADWAWINHPYFLEVRGLWPLHFGENIKRLDEVQAPGITVAVADDQIRYRHLAGVLGDPLHDSEGYRINMGMLDGHAQGIDVLPGQVRGTGWKLDYRE